MLIANAADSGANDVNNIKAWFQTNAIDYCHHFHGNMTVWNSLGYDYYIPFDVLVDRDHMVRKIGHGGSGAAWQTCIEELTGY